MDSGNWSGRAAAEATRRGPSQGTANGPRETEPVREWNEFRRRRHDGGARSCIRGGRSRRHDHDRRTFDGLTTGCEANRVRTLAHLNGEGRDRLRAAHDLAGARGRDAQHPTAFRQRRPCARRRANRSLGRRGLLIPVARPMWAALQQRGTERFYLAGVYFSWPYAIQSGGLLPLCRSFGASRHRALPCRSRQGRFSRRRTRRFLVSRGRRRGRDGTTTFNVPDFARACGHLGWITWACQAATASL